MGTYQGPPTPVSENYISLTRPPATSFITGQVPAPTEMYVAGDAQIRLTIFNTQFQFPTTVTFSYKLILSDSGNITTFEELIQTTISSTGIFLFPLQEGFLVSAELAQGSAANRGQVFVVAEVVRGSGADLKFEKVLFADYVVSNQSIGFPTSRVEQSVDGRGFPDVVHSGAFTAGTEVNTSPRILERMNVIALSLGFTASAAVANRTPELRVTITQASGNRVIARIPIPGNITAGQVVGLEYMASGPQPVLNNGVYLMPLPGGLIMRPGDTITTVTGGLQAGDQYTSADLYGETWVDG